MLVRAWPVTTDNGKIPNVTATGAESDSTRVSIVAGLALGWVDLNLVALLERTILRPLFRSPIQWTPRRAMPEVTHRVGALDLA